MYRLAAIYLNLTDRCNLHCRHCWLSARPVLPSAASDQAGVGVPARITLERMEAVIDQALPLGLQVIKLSGGEPFLCSDLLRFTTLFHAKGLTIDIETNGTRIDRSTAQVLGGQRIRCISVSLDSADASQHDRFRGMSGAFGQTIKGLEHLTENGIRPQVIMSLTRENADQIRPVAFLARQLGADSLKINPVVPMGRGRRLHEDSQNLGVEELLAIASWVRNDLQPEFDLPIYLDLPMAFEPMGNIISGGHAQCAVLNILGITENGDISFCGVERFEKDLVMGNIHADAIDHVWRNHPLLQLLRDSVPRRLEGICGACLMKRQCLGSCRACAYHIDKSLTAPHWFCRAAFAKGLFPHTRYLG